MKEQLAELLVASHGQPVKWGDHVVHGFYEISGLAAGARLTIEFLCVVPPLPQSLALSCKGGRLEVNGQDLKEIGLWSDTVPALVVAVARPASRKRPLSVQLWNEWRDEDGVVQAWIGNAGMIIEEEEDHMILRCSNGEGEATFDDLVVEVTITR
jgi:hypothetical protein